MATITGFTINTATSDLNPGQDKSVAGDDKGIQLEGSFTYTGAGSVPGGSAFTLYVLEGTPPVETKVQGANIAFVSNGDGTGTFSLTLNENQTNKAGISNGDDVKFKFVFNNGTGDTADDTVVTTSPTIHIYCFYPGTMIATEKGEVAVEELAIGDMVVRHDGSASAVRWMGRNTVATMFASKLKSLPIRIKRDALAANVPSRDLLVSPDHAIFVDGILAHAGALVNGTSIVRETNVPSTFTYYHIELAEHSLVMAENTAAESFIDNVDRANYDNWAEHEALYGDLPALVEMELPRAKSARQVPPATRQRLAARAVELGYSAVDAAVA